MANDETRRSIEVDGMRVKQIYGIYAFVRKDWLHPPLPDISRTLKAGKHDTSILIEYE